MHRQTDKEEKPSERAESVDLSEKLQFLFDLNIQLLTSQVVLGLELDYKNILLASAQEIFNTNVLYVSLSSLNVFTNKISSHELSLPNNNNDILLRHHSNPNTSSVNHAYLHVCDFQSKIQLINDNNTHFKENLHFVGPTSLKASLIYDMGQNELYSSINLGSINVTVNRKLVDFFLNLSSCFISKDTNSTGTTTKAVIPKKSEQNEFKLEFLQHEDDLRNGSFRFSIIDENYVKQSLKSPHVDVVESSNFWLMSHVKLPDIDEIICVDDMATHMLTSSISWRYATRRAITNLKIQPLPFVGSIADLSKSITEASEAKLSLKCYLEYLNECTKRFCVLKEFTLEEGAYTHVINTSKDENPENLSFAKVWRIRLSNEAKRFIYASSLLASCVVDSIEFSQTLLGSKRLFHSHAEFTCDNLELKLNTVNLGETHSMKTADLVSVNLNEFALKCLVNKCKN